MLGKEDTQKPIFILSVARAIIQKEKAIDRSLDPSSPIQYPDNSNPVHPFHKSFVVSRANSRQGPSFKSFLPPLSLESSQWEMAYGIGDRYRSSSSCSRASLKSTVRAAALFRRHSLE
jgi:hypothetical protein